MMRRILKKLPQIPEIYATENEDNPKAYLKFYNLFGRGTWYVTEKEVQKNDVRFFGYCESPLGEDCDEWGYFTLNELLNANLIFDTGFKPTPIKEVI